MPKNPFPNPGNSIPDYAPKTQHHSPFMRAKQVWDDRIAAPTIEKRNWQIVSGFFAVGMIMSLGILGYREVYAPLPAYAVPVNEQGLTAGNARRLDDSRYTPSREQISAHISQWVIWMRSRPSDGFTLRNNLLMAEAFMSAEGIALHNGYKEKFDPWANYRHSKDYSSKVTVTVSGPNPHPDKSILTFPRVTQNEANSYQAEWTETRWENGIPSEPYPMTMTIHAKATPQTDERKMDINPGGTSIGWWEWRGKDVSRK
jgi:type IV secretory pathway TrbF-like protein